MMTLISHTIILLLYVITYTIAEVYTDKSYRDYSEAVIAAVISYVIFEVIYWIAITILLNLK